MTLIPYAGKDIEPEPNPKRARVYAHFKRGADTYDIAKFYHMSEATVLRWITDERCKQRGLGTPIAEIHSNRILVVQGVPGVRS